jgi:glycosyltransferase involved in cell wall biosynthesis
MYKSYNYNLGKIMYSVVIPIYNQEKIIVENLKSIIENTLGNFEIIMILDYCFDETEKNILFFLENYVNRKDELMCIKIFKNDEIPLFETKCDNIGFKNSEGDYCIEIQADMKMIELGYNIHLTKPFNLMNNIIAVSGRCAHNLYEDGGIGKLGYSIEISIDKLNVDKNKFYVLDTCNRGPLLIDRKKLEELNYLDENDYFLDNSDHDLMARAYLTKGYICGYVPIDFLAPIDNGSTRNENNYNNCKEYMVNKQELEKLKKIIGGSAINKYRHQWICKQPIEYNI